MTTSSVVLITLVIYKVFLLGVGFWASKRVQSETDYFLGGQNLGAWTAGLSYAASTSSAWVLLGFTGLVYTQGIVGLWLIPGIFFGYYMTWFVLGPRLNSETTDRGHITIVDFIGADLTGKWRRRIGIVCACIILFSFTFYISSQLQAAGNALTENFDIGTVEAIIVGFAIIIIYCLLGGFWAASVTDAFQAAVMMLACIIVPVATVSAAGGMGEVLNSLRASEPASYLSWSGKAAGMAGLGFVLGLIGNGLGAMGQPQLLNRIMAVKSQSERVKAASITIGWGIVIYTGLSCLALAGRALNVETGDEGLIFAAARAFLPAVLAGIVTAAVLSAIMSTVDSLLLAAASAVSHDLGIEYESPARALFFGRVAMVVIALVAILVTIFWSKDIFNMTLFAWVPVGAAFGPAVLTRCMGWKVKAPYLLAAILLAFLTAVFFALQPGDAADVIEKWGSWLVGLTILFVGRSQKSKA